MTQRCKLEERREKVMAVAATDYHSSDDAAMDYLASIEGTNVEEQKQLFRLILAIHGARQRKEHKCPLPNSIEPKEWKAIAGRLREMVKGWSRSAVRNNAGLEVTADMLWDELTLCEGKDRVVALGLLLDQAAVPYAQLPGNLTIVKPQDVYDDAHDRILDKIALFNRVEKADDSSILEISVAMTKIIEGIDCHEERVAFLANFLRKVIRRLGRAEMAENVMDSLGGAIMGHLRMELDRGHEDNTENDD